MKYIVLVISLLILANGLPAQVMPSYNEDSLKAILNNNPQGTTRIDVLLSLASSYFFKQPDTCLLYATAALDSSRRLKYDSGTIVSLIRGGEAMRVLGDFTGTLKNQFEALELSQKIGDDFWEANSTGFVGMNYVELKDYDQAFAYLKKAITMHKNLKIDGADLVFRIYLALAYNETDKPDSAIYILHDTRIRATFESARTPDGGRTPGFSRQIQLAFGFGDAFLQAKKIDSAIFYYRRALTYAFENPRVGPNNLCRATYKLATVFNARNQIDSSFYFARFVFRIAREKRLNPRILDASSLLSQLHRKTGKLDSALFYQDIAIAANESMYGKDKSHKLQLLLLQQQRRAQEVQRAEEKRILEDQQSQERFRNNILIIGLVTVTTIILVASILLFRSNRIKQKTNLVLQQTLNELKATQSQLIQSEKMASLGELTAGIAHEIQNPLNFVNNFAEVNKELIADMEAALLNGNLEEAKDLAKNIADNQEKINSHGKRADGIVKSMLQHSRSSSGQKELTDINALCDEYLRLTYHGYRAKDKTFNAKVNTNFDLAIPKVNVVRQDIGRVLLNLINNAFYTVNEKAKSNANEYEPCVTVSTKLVNARPDDPVGRGKTEICVQDNGNGIPGAVKEKIFQPFFTTKPTGQGTGLGLSLSYDIVKAHGGELIVRTEEGIGSEFIIRL